MSETTGRERIRMTLDLTPEMKRVLDARGEAAAVRGEPLRSPGLPSLDVLQYLQRPQRTNCFRWWRERRRPSDSFSHVRW